MPATTSRTSPICERARAGRPGRLSGPLTGRTSSRRRWCYPSAHAPAQSFFRGSRRPCPDGRPDRPADRGVPRAPSRGCRARRRQGDLRSALGQGLPQHRARTLHASPVERRAQPRAADRVGHRAFRDPAPRHAALRPRADQAAGTGGVARAQNADHARDCAPALCAHARTCARSRIRGLDLRRISHRDGPGAKLRTRLRARVSAPRHRSLGRHRRQRAGERDHHRRHPHAGHPVAAPLPRACRRPAPLPGPKGHRAARRCDADPLAHGLAERRSSKVGALGVRAEQRRVDAARRQRPGQSTYPPDASAR